VLTSATVVPAAPVLVPEVAQGAVGELDDCRQAIDSALDAMLAQAPDVVVLVGAGVRTVRHGDGARGSMRPVGVDLSVSLGPTGVASARRDSLPPAQPPVPPPSLPVSLTVGAWLLTRTAWVGPVSGLEVAAAAAPQVCLGVGVGLADDRSRTALLVVADGTARRGPKAPGYTDERADAFDRGWLGAVGRADAESLAILDPGLAEELMMSGRAPLQVLAGASQGRTWAGELLYADAPYGVQYAVAQWLPAGD
jgi:hypothetical protein